MWRGPRKHWMKSNLQLTQDKENRCYVLFPKMKKFNIGVMKSSFPHSPVLSWDTTCHSKHISYVFVDSRAFTCITPMINYKKGQSDIYRKTTLED